MRLPAGALEELEVTRLGDRKSADFAGRDGPRRIAKPRLQRSAPSQRGPLERLERRICRRRGGPGVRGPDDRPIACAGWHDAEGHRRPEPEEEHTPHGSTLEPWVGHVTFSPSCGAVSDGDAGAKPQKERRANGQSAGERHHIVARGLN